MKRIDGSAGTAEPAHLHLAQFSIVERESTAVSN